LSTVKGAAPGRLSLPAVLAFACAYLPFAALQLSVTVQLPRFFATHLGIALAVVGGSFGLVRAIDIPLDPALGMLIDRTYTRFGRYRLWLVASVPILMLALYMLYQAQPGVGQLYIVGWLLIMYLGMSTLLLSANSWAAALATSYGDRSRIFGALTGVGVAGALCCLIIPIIVARSGGDDAGGTRAVGWFLMAAAPIAVGLAVLTTPEQPPRRAPGAHFQLADYARLLLRPNILRLLAADLCVTLGPGWMAALYLFFFKDSRGFDTTAANVLLLFYIAAGLVGAPATAWLANRISKHRALIVTTTGYSLSLILIFLLPKGAFAPMALAMFVAGALAAGFVVMIRALTADIGDEIRLEGGREQIALLYALTSATTKLASAFAITLTFSVLAAMGYDAREGAHNTAAAILGLQLAYVIGPTVFVMLGGACFLGYKLSAERHAEIRRQLEARDAAVAEEAAVLQTLTGEPGEVVVSPR
jgi:GPH family glycoside/pentoside/hexuronide:cation symporter